MNSNFIEFLLKDYSRLYESENFYDVIIKVGDESNFKEFRVHSIILCARSKYFRTALSNKWANIKDGKIYFDKPNSSIKAFDIILKYIYNGNLDFNEQNGMILLEVLKLADELCLTEILDYIQDYILKYHKNWLRENFYKVYQFTLKHNEFFKLNEYIKDIITNAPEFIFNDTDISNISQEFLISLIQLDGLQLDEIEIWNHVIKWGIARTSNLSNELSSWSDNDFKALKENLNPLISFIRFGFISSSDFYIKINPYRKIFEENFYQSILEYYLVPEKRDKSILYSTNFRCRLDSILIDSKQLRFISKWISKDSYFKFELLTRGSRDGFSEQVFHNRCDSKDHSLTILRIKNTGEILGGYNPLNWASKRDYYVTNDSFIFSLNKEDINKSIISKVINSNCAIYNCKERGPRFGRHVDGGKDDLMVYVSDKRFECTKNSYDKLIAQSNQFDEYEVFQVIKKS
ncbi:hypothetical protein GLOIN_2v130112 [Rhizophagus irregularis DAOM 181602=DAOM 197198]|uniref:Serine-enriched protein n=2 Tax=Rhizophagus irregularis TaxID=588596 RepID=A0A015M1E0_RHIIW|nr:hypothetical protein GLOIN_2v130112 [Rhizophagus irregularis DAOM 181602=DAOM 197198]EXX78801.1 hypothetical protein RirG_011800 [Rhizophagus irregularis DAOM 197198w]POG70269.1 hypothetical protein GLOIN_2v130112 [Rhizophagus irregularis DAOM 181602=DAOM 197198]GET54668.1 hypothetical protein GLOIN_2v130112 [Rhizophagus irregularis DAOM 181602=DAOM 197198]|eukprot:XP_025177135.1 hypothetical protein GLOIN_2v130112 [Rhizophagus irregularis DAOM 181602=DAOM 197198]